MNLLKHLKNEKKTINKFLYFFTAIACIAGAVQIDKTVLANALTPLSLNKGKVSTSINDTITQNEDKTISSSQNLLLEYEKNNISVYQNTHSSVVSVSNMRLTRSMWDNFDSVEVPAGSGSGFIWDDQGHIVTNYHVIHQGDSFMISFKGDTKQYKAKVVGAEPKQDIAVLKLIDPPKNLKPVIPGSSRNLVVGQKTLAIGNPFGLSHSLSTGVVSSLDRSIEGFTGLKIRGMIQTDASINPGNSGGILLDSQGKVIGMNTMIFSKSGSSAGIGFAVPIDSIKRIVGQILKFGRVKQPALGIAILDNYYRERFFGLEKGVVVRSVKNQGAADKAGIIGLQKTRNGYKLGDIITKINTEEVNSYDDLYYVLDRYKIGEKVQVEVLRNNSKKVLTVQLEELQRMTEFNGEED